jgi:predicted dehydrogenase
VGRELIHPFDTLYCFFDEPVATIFSDQRHVSDAGDCEDHAKVVLKTTGPTTIDMEISTSAATDRRAPAWTFLGTCGALTINGNEARIRWFDPADVDPIEVIDRTMAAERRYGNEDELPWQEQTVTLGPGPALRCTLRPRALPATG